MLKYLCTATLFSTTIIFQHICREIGIPPKSRQKIEEYGIRTLVDLLEVRTQLEKGNLKLLQVRDKYKENLANAAEWKIHNPDLNVIEEFDEDVFEEFCETCTIKARESIIVEAVEAVDKSNVQNMDQEMKVSILYEVVFTCGYHLF